MYLKGKVYFKNPKQKECIGFQDAGTCLDCLKKDSSKISCSRMGDFLDKNMWNRVIGNGPLFQKDYKTREETESPDAFGNMKILDRKGKFGRKVA